MSIIDTLITDRKKSDVSRLRELKQKALENGGIDALTPEERTEYFNSPKGAYNYTDLNRVGEAVEYLKQLYRSAGVALPDYMETAKTNWTVSDIQTKAQMSAYLENIRVLRIIARSRYRPPNSMDALNYESANTIEKIIQDANTYIERLTKDYLYSGEFEAGEN